MRRQPNDFRFEISDFGLNRALLALMVLFLMNGTALAGSHSPRHMGQSAIENRKSEMTKWDAGQKDLLASMEAEKTTARAKEEPMYMTLLSFIFKLAVVVALAYGTIHALKRLNVHGLKRSSTQTIRVVENTSLAANRSLHLVEVGSKRLLVASTPGQISLLTEVDSEQLTVDIREGSAPAETVNCELSTVNSFGKQFASFLGAKPDTGDAERNVAQAIRGSSAFLQEKIMAVGRMRRDCRLQVDDCRLGQIPESETVHDA